MPGVARRQVSFSCLAKSKETKEKATLLPRPYGLLCAARQSGETDINKKAGECRLLTLPLTSILSRKGRGH